MNNKRWTEQEKNKLRAVFPKRKNQEIANILGKSKRGVEKQAKRLNIKKDTQWRAMLNGENRRVRYFNKGYFSVIDNPNKAYLLGFIYADGNVTAKRKALHITLALKDDKHVVNICKELGADPLKSITRRKTLVTLPQGTKGKYSYSTFLVHSKETYEDLLKLGVHPNKTLTIKFPSISQVPKKFQCDFIRGFFDGDGHYAQKKKQKVTRLGFTCGSKGFLNSIAEICCFQCNSSLKQEKLRKGRYSTRDIHYSAYQDIVNISNYMYQNYNNSTSTITLKRKYDLYQKLLNQPQLKSQVNWTDKEKQILKILYPIFPTHHIVDYFPNRNESSIQGHASRVLKLHKTYGTNQYRTLPINKPEMDALIKELL